MDKKDFFFLNIYFIMMELALQTEITIDNEHEKKKVWVGNMDGKIKIAV